MNFIQGLSNYCAKGLANKVPNTKFPSVEDQIQVYSYGIQVIVGGLVKGFILIILALLSGIFLSNILSTILTAIIIVLTFSSLRILAGGYHMQTYNRCIFLSLLMFLGSAFIIQNTYQYWNYYNIWSLFIFCIVVGLYTIIKYAPKDTSNKPITKQSDILRLKKWSLYYLFLWSILMIICMLVNFKLVVISSCFGLLLELFSVSNFGYYKVYKKLDTIK